VGVPLGKGQEARFLGNVFAGFDCATLIARKHVTTFEHIRSVIDVLDAASLKIAGTVLV
jgi:hypothetical protein